MMNNETIFSDTIGCVLLISCAPIFAATESGNREQKALETVNVVGTRQAYRGAFSPLETPQAELVIGKDILKNSGATDLNQALDLSASVARQNNFGGLWNSFALRGFVGDENLPSNFLVNGFNAGRGFGGPRDLSGIETVEVLKGPRSALYGRGEPGGTINLVTKLPTFKREGEISLSAGSYDSYRTDIDYTSPISEAVAFRIVEFYEDAGSFRDTVDTSKQGLSPSLSIRVGENSQLLYELEYSHQEIPFDRGVLAIDGKLGVIPEDRFLGEPGDGPIETDVIGHQIEFQHNFNDHWGALVGMNFRDTSLEGYATENSFGAPDDEGNFGRFSRYRDYDATYQVLRAEITGGFETGSVTHRLIVGIDVDEFEIDQFALRDRTTDQSINIFNPVYGAYPLPASGLVTQIDRIETQETVGLYLQDQISLTENLELRFGARFDDYQQEMKNRRSSTTSDYSESRLSPQLGFVYRVSDTLSLYAVYGENFRPLSGATDENGLDPNESKSTELGVKFSLLDGSLNGNVSVFKVEQSNIATVDGDWNATAIGKAQSQGVEVDLNGQLSETVSLWLSYAFVDTETKNAFNDPNFGTEVPSGSDLLNVPEHQLSLQVVQRLKIAEKELRLVGGLIHVDDRNGYFSNQDFRLPSYTTVRVAANYIASESLEIGAELNNLFDEEYYTNSFSDVWVQPGTPVNARVSAKFRF